MDTLHLFDAELRYTDETTPVVAPDGREGDLIGSGVGRVTGSLLSGTLGWSFYAADCAYLAVRAGFEHPVDELCRTHPGGEIRTDDGALIRWDARGFGLRGADPARLHRWRMASAIVFDTDDDRYAWLNRAMAVWQGEFDERVGVARYSAWLPADDVPSSARRAA
jgi:hypothetical protein